ncbi:MAG TPA: DUF4430 domain-containing protein [Thermoleophilaceae bacterium]|nr:DUF4430 domain-containing protein [Thermoleophilaceae bacterium]
MRRARPIVSALLVACLAPAAAGCGFGEGKERAGGAATLRVTRDFGHRALGSAKLDKVREGDTVMRLLRSNFDITTRFGGRFVQSIDGLKGKGAGGQVDWFFWVNGLEADKGAAEWDIDPGDRILWDRRDWTAAMRVPAIVGSYPAPFTNGVGGKRRPVRVECDDVKSRPCIDARGRLQSEGVPTSGSSIGAPGVEVVTRLVVALWPKARGVRGASELVHGPDTSGVFARFSDDGTTLQLLDEHGDSARTVRRGDGVGLVFALQPRAEELVWVVTALDESGLEAGVRALDERKLRDAFAVAATGDRVEKLPLVGR